MRCGKKKNLRVFGEFEDAEDAQDADEGEAAAAFRGLAVTLCLLDHQYHEVREDGQHVDDVHHVAAEVPLRRTRREPQEKLAREPRHARLPVTHTTQQMKKRSERRKHCAQSPPSPRRYGCSNAEPKVPPAAVPLPGGGGAGPPKSNQLEMVTTCTYRPSLVKIDARNFELSW